MEQIYLLGEDETTLLWSDRTVKLFFDTVQKPPWVLSSSNTTPPMEEVIHLQEVHRSLWIPWEL